MPGNTVSSPEINQRGAKKTLQAKVSNIMFH